MISRATFSATLLDWEDTVFLFGHEVDVYL